MGVAMLRKPLPLVVLGLLSLLLVASGPNGPYGFPLSNIVNPDVDEISPALTFNTGFTQTYAAAWQHNIGGPDNVIYARRTSAGGQLIGNAIPVSPLTGQNTDPDIVYNRDADQ